MTKTFLAPSPWSGVSLRKIFFPYEELSFAWSSETEFTLATPWLKVPGEIHGADRARVEKAVADWKAGAGKVSVDVQWLLSPFQGFPFCYIVPREGLREREPYQSVSELTARALERRMKGSPRAWDLAPALGLSQLSGTTLFDPLSLTTALRRYRWQLACGTGALRQQKYEQWLQEREQKPSALRKKVAWLVRQNLYVTSRCESALLPAMARFGFLRGPLSAFLRSEMGHERWIRNALLALEETPESLPVAPAAQALMDLLATAAHDNPFGMALLIDLFESASYERLHPLARLLRSTPWEEAGRWQQLHRDVNVGQSHAQVGIELLEAFPPIGESTARCGARILEQALVLAEGLD